MKRRPRKPLPEPSREELERTAYHEAAVLLLPFCRLRGLESWPHAREGMLGCTPTASPRPDPPLPPAEARLLARGAVLRCLAGPAAESLAPRNTAESQEREAEEPGLLAQSCTAAPGSWASSVVVHFGQGEPRTVPNAALGAGARTRWAPELRTGDSRPGGNGQGPGCAARAEGLEVTFTQPSAW